MSDSSALRQFVAKLERRSPLPDADRAALLAVPCAVRSYLPSETVLDEDVSATHCAIVGKGFVSRVKHLDGGARQIVALHIAGDAVDLQSILFTKTDHQLTAHAPMDVCWIAHGDLLDLATRRPVVAKALWLDTLVDASIFREWTANVGQRSAQQRIAHLFLEMHARLDAIGLVDGDAYELPLTQTSLAEALGLSLVHMNKSLQVLRQTGLVATRHRTIILENRAALVSFTGFDPSYLHLDQTRIKSLVSPTRETQPTLAGLEPVRF